MQNLFDKLIAPGVLQPAASATTTQPPDWSRNPALVAAFTVCVVVHSVWRVWAWTGSIQHLPPDFAALERLLRVGSAVELVLPLLAGGLAVVGLIRMQPWAVRAVTAWGLWWLVEQGLSVVMIRLSGEEAQWKGSAYGAAAVAAGLVLLVLRRWWNQELVERHGAQAVKRPPFTRRERATLRLVGGVPLVTMLGCGAVATLMVSARDEAMMVLTGVLGSLAILEAPFVVVLSYMLVRAEWRRASRSARAQAQALS